MDTQRFKIRREIDGTWTIFDVFSGLHVIVGDEPTIGLEFEDANDLVDLMNSLDRERRSRSIFH